MYCCLLIIHYYYSYLTVKQLEHLVTNTVDQTVWQKAYETKCIGTYQLNLEKFKVNTKACFLRLWNKMNNVKHADMKSKKKHTNWNMEWHSRNADTRKNMYIYYGIPATSLGILEKRVNLPSHDKITNHKSNYRWIKVNKKANNTKSKQYRDQKILNLECIVFYNQAETRFLNFLKILKKTSNIMCFY